MNASAAGADCRPSSKGLDVATAIFMVLAIGAQIVRDRGWQPYQPENSLLWIQSGPLASRLALGFDNLVADVYWMRAVIYYGTKEKVQGRRPNFDQLAPLLDLVTALDPHFRVAYRFGAIFLTEAYPNGPGRPDLAVALLQRAIENDFGRWEVLRGYRVRELLVASGLREGGRMVCARRRSSRRSRMVAPAGGDDPGARRRSPIVPPFVATVAEL